MKPATYFLLLLLVCIAVAGSGSAQSGVKDSITSVANEPTKPVDAKREEAKDSRAAAQLFEEADHYAQKKFDEFEKRHMPFDARTAEKIRQEQRDLAARYATTVSARKLEGNDSYYLGMLYNLS